VPVEPFRHDQDIVIGLRISVPARTGAKQYKVGEWHLPFLQQAFETFKHQAVLSAAYGVYSFHWKYSSLK
jgi:hypothetical protein